MNVCLLISTTFKVKADFLIKISVLLSMVVILESSERKNLSSRPLTINFILVSSGITRGRAFKLWGAIGVNTKLFAWGIRMGPPQLKEYPVEPVGVEIIKPSAQYEVKYSSSKYVSMVIIEAVFFLLTETSFKAKLREDKPILFGVVVTLNKERL